MLSERQRYRNFLMREEAGKEYMKTIDSAVKKPDGSYYKAFENGLLVVPAGSNVIRIVPPLTISRNETKQLLKKLYSIFKDF